MLARVVEPKKEEMPEASKLPPVKVNPLEENNPPGPAWAKELNVEEAVFETAEKVEA